MFQHQLNTFQRYFHLLDFFFNSQSIHFFDSFLETPVSFQPQRQPAVDVAVSMEYLSNVFCTNQYNFKLIIVRLTVIFLLFFLNHVLTKFAKFNLQF